ncbi:MAG: alpha/beta hydrolase [Bacteroidales bacterium]|nr:alpha/beta hydrolase [Bacteroidales bacterium]
MQSKNSYRILKAKRRKEEKAKSPQPSSLRAFESSSLQAFEPSSLQACQPVSHILFLHGLFDSTLSWKPIADLLSEKFDVHILPLRNHRGAKRCPTMSFEDMADDVKAYADEHNIEKFTFVGHSLGGKTAMQFALKYPQMLEKVVVIDISPCRMNSLLERNPLVTNLMNQVQAIKNLPLADFHSFAEFANGISAFDDDTKRAIIGNIKYDGKAFSWQIDIDAVFNNFDKLTSGFDVDDFIDRKINVQTLFIKAMDSEFLPKSDYKAVKYIFPNSEIVEIADCTHRIHFEKPKVLAEVIASAL